MPWIMLQHPWADPLVRCNNYFFFLKWHKGFSKNGNEQSQGSKVTPMSQKRALEAFRVHTALLESPNCPWLPFIGFHGLMAWDLHGKEQPWVIKLTMKT